MKRHQLLPLGALCLAAPALVHAIEPAPLPKPKPKPATETPVQSTEDLASDLIAKARELITRGENVRAIALLDRMLRLPPNAQTPEAMELSGLVRERLGELSRARSEYESYLKLYPEGEGAERVRQRLDAIATPTAQPALKAARSRTERQWLNYGSVSMAYYHGASQIETNPNDPANPNPADKVTLSSTDESMLVTSFDATARMRDARYDMRAVARGSYSKSFIDTVDDRSRPDAAYLLVKDQVVGYQMQAGRQPGNSGGILGRFDGLIAGYQVLPWLRASVDAGQLVDYYSSLKKKFAGGYFELGPFDTSWRGSWFAIAQTVNGLTDRQAVGADIAYSAEAATISLLVDYDLWFNELNTTYFQGNWQISTGTQFNVAIDRRKSPTLQTSNAMLNTTFTTMEEMQALYTEERLRELALARTPTSYSYEVGLTHPLSERFQVGGDLRLARVTATETIDGVPGNADSGNIISAAARGTAQGLLGLGDYHTATLSFITSPDFDGQSASLSSRMVLSDAWTVEGTFQYYAQDDTNSVHVSRLLPTLGILWRIDPWNVELRGGTESSKSTSPTIIDDTFRSYGSLLVRRDF